MLNTGAKKAALSVEDMLIRSALVGAFLGYAASLAAVATKQTGLGIATVLIFFVGLVIIVLLGLES